MHVNIYWLCATNESKRINETIKIMRNEIIMMVPSHKLDLICSIHRLDDIDATSHKSLHIEQSTGAFSEGNKLKGPIQEWHSLGYDNS